MLKTAANQQEETYQRNMTDMISEHNGRLQAMITRAEETERIFIVSRSFLSFLFLFFKILIKCAFLQEYQKRTEKDLAELSKVRAENATLKSKISILQAGGQVGGTNDSLVSKSPHTLAQPPFLTHVLL